MNLTQTEPGQWYSLSNEEIFRNKKHLGTIYQSYLAAEVERLGYEIEPRPHGQFELKGYQPADLVEFSKRRQQILAEVPAGSTWQTREDAWSLTRKHKQHLSPAELKSRWQAEAAALKIQIVQPNQHYRPSAPRRTPSEYLDDAISHCSERSVEFTREDLEKFAIAHRMPTDIAEIATLTARHPQLIAIGKKFTTFAALRREDETISLMKRGEGQLTPIATPATVTAALDRSTLNIGQRQAVRLAATTTNRVVAWQGVAGAGKTYALAQLKEIAERQGYELSGYAPSAAAAQVLGGELGIPADTVAKKLVTPPAKPTHNRVWVVDEAGLLGASEAMQLLRLAETENARVLLVGDTRQLSAVSAGNPFKSLQQAGMATARLSQSLRQHNPDLKTAVDLLADGMVEQGFHQLDLNGSIIDVSAATMVAQIAREYMVSTPAQRAKTLVLAGTNAMRREIVGAIRSRLQIEGTIGADNAAIQLQARNLTKIELSYPHNFNEGDLVVPLRDYQRRGLVKGERYAVVGTTDDKLILTASDGRKIETDAMFDKSLYLPQSIDLAVGDRCKWTRNDRVLERRNGQEFTIEAIEGSVAGIKYQDGRTETLDLRQAQHLDHALVITTYSSQGKTADCVFIAADEMVGMESFYVGCSRARDDLKIFTTDRAELLARAQESRANPNPRDLLLRQALLKADRSIATERGDRSNQIALDRAHEDRTKLEHVNIRTDLAQINQIVGSDRQWMIEVHHDSLNLQQTEDDLYSAAKFQQTEIDLITFDAKFGTTTDRNIISILDEAIRTIDGMKVPQHVPSQVDESAAQTISLKDWFVNLTKKLIDLSRPKPEPQRQEPTPKPQHQQQASAKYRPITSQETRPDLAELAIGLLQRVDSSTIDFGTYQIEIDGGERTRPIIKIIHQNKLSMTIEQTISNRWISKVANADRPIDRQEKELEYLLKTANIKLDLVKDYETRVLNKIPNLARSILNDDYVNSVLLETIESEIVKISLSDYNRKQQATFERDSIKKLVDTVDWHHRCLDLEYLKLPEQLQEDADDEIEKDYGMSR